MRNAVCRSALVGWSLALALLLACLPGVARAADDDDDPASAFIAKTQAPWTGDLNGMIERRVIRVLVAPTRTLYWVENGRQSGISYETAVEFEKAINKKYRGKQKHLKIQVVFIPTARDNLIPALLEGRGDIAAAGLTITPERLREIDFGGPFASKVKEILVAGPASPAVATIRDLAGKTVVVRHSSSYWTHLEAISGKLEVEGLPPIRLRAAPEDLQDDDLLEMLAAGLIELTVVDQYEADLWAQVFPAVRPQTGIVINQGGDMGWMVRKDSPVLKKEIDAFARKVRQGTAFGNEVIRKYTGNARLVKRATEAEEMVKFEQTVDLFRLYAGRYEMDYLLMMAQGYQESRLDQTAKSPAGAVGIMQVMPETGRDMAAGDISQLEPNIHAGVKYVRWVQDQFFEQEAMDAVNKTLFSFAAYNAGPRRVQELRRLAQKRRLNPNVWFNNVELLAAEKIGAETVTYVSNIYKYYVAYRLLMETQEDRQLARSQLGK